MVLDLEKYRDRKGVLVGVLQEIQSEFRYLPEEELRRVSEVLGVPLAQLYALATFYNAFSLTPRGEHTVCVCMGTACHVRGAHRVLEEFERELCVKAGETTGDRRFSLETVNCLGACALGPLVTVDEDYHGNMTVDRVRKVLKKYEGE
jgi:NADH-quinone oxidoreductase subunit E